MSAAPDWADDLAVKIADDVVHHHEPKDLIAARLRVVKHEGIMEGLTIAATTVKGICRKDMGA